MRQIPLYHWLRTIATYSVHGQREVTAVSFCSGPLCLFPLCHQTCRIVIVHWNFQYVTYWNKDESGVYLPLFKAIYFVNPCNNIQLNGSGQASNIILLQWLLSCWLVMLSSRRVQGVSRGCRLHTFLYTFYCITGQTLSTQIKQLRSK